jgi:hypothetical protein
MKWMEVIVMLTHYFRVEDHNPEDSVREVVIDEHLDLKIVCLNDQLLSFLGYFTKESTENDLPKLKNMLQWNFACIAEMNDIISIESESNRLCLFRKRPLGEFFADNIYLEIESFIANLAFWADAFEYTCEAPCGFNLMGFGF